MEEKDASGEKQDLPVAQARGIKQCPYCQGTDFAKAGFRVKKHEKIQLFYCNRCQKKFTPLISKGKTYPLTIILESLILRNRFHSPLMISKAIKKKYGLEVASGTVVKWIEENRAYMPFSRMWRYLLVKMNKGEINPKEVIHEHRLFHGPGQIYDFKFHRGKTLLLLEETYRNYKLRPLKEFLELVIAECPHQVFKKNNLRSSDFFAKKSSGDGVKGFNLDEVRITPKKDSLACDIARLVTQAVANNKQRHERVQEFMLFCDSTTLAVEVPVLLDYEDIWHFKNILKFNVPLEINSGQVITGHIDLIQIRNGMVHIMDFKPSARKAKPVEQLTIYALALSRLTGLRLYNFKCAWFDENDYFEFFPLHIVYKKKKKGKKKNS